MFAFIVLWIVQWYANVPAFEKVWLKVCPGATVLLSNEPSSAVTVCPVVSSLVHVTDEPTEAVRDAGANAKFLIWTAEPPAAEAAGPAGDAAAEAGADEVDVDPQPASASARMTPPATRRDPDRPMRMAISVLPGF